MNNLGMNRTGLAETIDAVIGIDPHRDTHEVEIADPAGKPIAVATAFLVAWEPRNLSAPA